MAAVDKREKVPWEQSRWSLLKIRAVWHPNAPLYEWASSTTTNLRQANETKVSKFDLKGKKKKRLFPGTLNQRKRMDQETSHSRNVKQN